MENYTIQPIHWTYRKNNTGLYVIKIMVTVNRVQTYITTPYNVSIGQWDKELRQVVDHPNAGLINISLRKEMAELESRIVTNGLQGGKISNKLIKGNSLISKSFFVYAREVRNDRTKLGQIKKYRGEQILISDITVEFLRKYETFMFEKKYSQNTVNSCFKYIHRIVNQAKKEKLIKENPFNDYRMPRYVQTDRVYLIDSEVKKLVELLDKRINKSQRVTLCYFLLACYTGMRHSDWGKFDKKMIEEGQLKFRATKNQNHIVLPIGPTLNKIIKAIEDLPAPFSNQKSNMFLKSIADKAGIEKEITTHTGRHSFGYMCASNGLPESTTAALMGISERVVRVYYHLAGNDVTRQAAILKTL